MFTDQKPFVLTEKQSKMRWGSRFRDGKLRCNLCGHKFKVGDIVRWIYANGPNGGNCGNFFTCKKCDGDDVLERGVESFEMAKKLAQNWGIYGPDWQDGMQNP